MASPVGHAAVGIAVAAVVARATGTPSSPALWIGAFIASGVPDLDIVPVVFGFSRRSHRHASHSFFVLALEIVVVVLAARLLAPGLAPGVLAAWSAALLSHPMLDVVTTGPTLARKQWGIPLLWPFSRHRFSVTRPLFGDQDEDLTVSHTLLEMRNDLLRIVPLCAIVALVTVLWP